MKIIKWILKKLITQERKYQIQVGYTTQHDFDMGTRDKYHLLEESFNYYVKGDYVAALALLEAQKELNAKVLSEYLYKMG